MTRPTRQRDHDRQRVRSEDADETETDAEGVEGADAGELDPEDFDPEELTRTADGELIHEETGLIVEEEQIDPGPEWRAFNHSERQSKSRVGAPTTKTMHDKGLTTTIDWKDKDAYGRSISSKKRSQMHRLRKWQERIRTKDAGERNLQFALSEIDRMASALGVPRSVREVASVIYRRALNEDLIRGRSIEGVSTAAPMPPVARRGSRARSKRSPTCRGWSGRRSVARTATSQELGLEMRPVDPKKYVPASPPSSN